MADFSSGDGLSKDGRTNTFSVRQRTMICRERNQCLELERPFSSPWDDSFSISQKTYNLVNELFALAGIVSVKVWDYGVAITLAFPFDWREVNNGVGDAFFRFGGRESRSNPAEIIDRIAIRECKEVKAVRIYATTRRMGWIGATPCEITGPLEEPWGSEHAITQECYELCNQLYSVDDGIVALQADDYQIRVTLATCAFEWKEVEPRIIRAIVATIFGGQCVHVYLSDKTRASSSVYSRP